MPHPSRHKRLSYLWLFLIFCALAGAHYFFFRFSFHELNPYPIVKGITFGLTLWTTALMLAMCMRLGWARYVLIALLVTAIVTIGLTVLMMNSQSVNALPEPVHAALGGLGLYALALVPLGTSRSLRRFLAPRQAGGR